ncbi:hypothetical protein NDU88_002855 [Pleurodeles waltl]|uniref:Uncharacterized protein n=1 Tax=Pleurodeles waltl TaxID=8319 RepID=A0AAV7UAX1_PLEWA|nr:hypothetical protein NDU88_002855 [Pleurodeles waltl]
MGKDKARKGTQQTRMDQYTAQTIGGSLSQEPLCPLSKGSEPTGMQILAAIEASGQAVKSQIAAMSDLRVVAECSVATEQHVTSMRADIDNLKTPVAALEVKMRRLELRVKDAEGRETKLKVLHAGRSHFFQTPEAVWDWLELGDGGGTPGSQSAGVCEQPAKMGNIQSALRQTSRRRRAARCTKVILQSDGTLSLDRRHREREEARLLVKSVTAEVSTRSGSPREDGGLTQDSDSTNA